MKKKNSFGIRFWIYSFSNNSFSDIRQIHMNVCRIQYKWKPIQAYKHTHTNTHYSIHIFHSILLTNTKNDAKRSVDVLFFWFVRTNTYIYVRAYIWHSYSFIHIHTRTNTIVNRIRKQTHTHPTTNNEKKEEEEDGILSIFQTSVECECSYFSIVLRVVVFIFLLLFVVAVVVVFFGQATTTVEPCTLSMHTLFDSLHSYNMCACVYVKTFIQTQIAIGFSV